MTVFSQIRKAVAATAGSAGAGFLGIASAVQWHLTSVTEGQVSGVLFLALSTGVATFALKNKELEAVIGEVEHVAADAGAKVAVEKVLPALPDVFGPAWATLQADLAAVLAAPLPAPADTTAAGAHAAPETPTPAATLTPGV